MDGALRITTPHLHFRLEARSAQKWRWALKTEIFPVFSLFKENGIAISKKSGIMKKWYNGFLKAYV